MAANFARFTMGGNIVKDPTVFDLDNGFKITVVRLAINKPNSYRKDFTGTKASYIDVKFFGKLAETASKYLSKGRAIVVWGSISDRTYTDKSGEQKTKTEFIAENYEYNDSKSSYVSKDSSVHEDEPVNTFTPEAYHGVEVREF